MLKSFFFIKETNFDTTDYHLPLYPFFVFNIYLHSIFVIHEPPILPFYSKEDRTLNPLVLPKIFSIKYLHIVYFGKSSDRKCLEGTEERMMMEREWDGIRLVFKRNHSIPNSYIQNVSLSRTKVRMKTV